MSLLRIFGNFARHPLTQHQKAKTLLRFIRWQIGTRVLSGSVILDWLPGTRIIVRRGENGMTGNVYCGLADFSDMAYLLHVLTPADLFVDVGANVGAYTILACGAKGARGYCFEPVPSTYKRLLDNIAINSLASKVEAMNIGLSDKEGELCFTAHEDCTNHVLADGEAESSSIRVPVRALDSILAKESPSVLKIDVEGFETFVLDGARETLRKPSLHSIIMEVNRSGIRYGFDDSGLLKRMNEYGFRGYEYEPFSRNLHPIPGNNLTNGNTLFIRGEGEVRQRITDAPRILIGSNEI